MAQRGTFGHNVGMQAYKFLNRDGTSFLSGFRWPVGAWVEADGPLGYCDNGIHACRLDDLPHWLGKELWLIELEGETLAAADSLVARRGRLLARVDAWSGGAAQEFADACGKRAMSLAVEAPSTAERAGDSVANAANGAVAAAAYIAATVAGEAGSGARAGSLYQSHFLSERTRQATWIGDRLSLSGG
jgi:hypothetical protein